jgi:hypothetical protein
LRGQRSARGSTASISTQAPAVIAADGPLLEEVGRPDAGGLTLLRTDAMHLTARGYHRVPRVARMQADLDGAEKVGRARLGEALSYRAPADERRRGEADANKPPRLPIEPVLLTSRSVPKGTNRHRSKAMLRSFSMG